MCWWLACLGAGGVFFRNPAMSGRVGLSAFVRVHVTLHSHREWWCRELATYCCRMAQAPSGRRGGVRACDWVPVTGKACRGACVADFSSVSSALGAVGVLQFAGRIVAVLCSCQVSLHSDPWVRCGLWADVSAARTRLWNCPRASAALLACALAYYFRRFD